MTYLQWSKGVEMAPTFGTRGSTLLVRRIPNPYPKEVHVGDVVVLKDSIKWKDSIVRRLAATQGHEIASTDKTDESLILKEGKCWVLADNENLNPKEARDSRTFGPVNMKDIVGRVIIA